MADETPDSPRRPLRLMIALGLTQIVSWGSTYYLFALLLVPLQRELGAERSLVVGAFSVSLLAAGAAAPWVGRIIDRRGGRAIMAAGSAAVAALLAALSLTQSLVFLYLVWIGLGVAMAATLYEPAFAVLTQLFRDGYRRAITTLTLFGGFASTVFWPLTTWLIESFGWRAAVLWLAALNLLICMPLHLWLLPSGAAVPPAADRAADAAAKWSWRSWARLAGDPVFLLLAGALLGQALVVSTLSVHLIALLQSKGLSAAGAAAIGALIGPMQVAGRIGELAVSGRLSALQVGRAVFLWLPAALLALYFAGTRTFWLLVFAFFYGAGNGAMTIVRGAAPAELFGRVHYGGITGALATPSLLARACGPFLAALIGSSGSAAGGYDTVLLVLTAIATVAAALFFAASRSDPV